MNFNHIIKDKKQLVIAEIAQSHDGSLNYVHSFIDEVARAGANIIKFQAHFASDESSKEESFRTFTTYKKETRFEYWKRMQFSNEEWAEIYKHVKKRKLLFSASVFSTKSITVLKKIGVDIWKIPSGESLDLGLIKEVTKVSSKPLFISTGMNTQKEVDNIYNFMKKKKNNFMLMHCVSQYPCEDKNMGMNILREYSKRYNCLIGYSDHSGKLEVPLIALENEINAVEVHVTFNKKLFNPDVTSSIDFNDLNFLCNYVSKKNRLQKFKVSKNILAKRVSKNRILFSKSLALKNDMKKNQVIKLNHIVLKKPGIGISWKDRRKVIGKVLTKNKSKNNLLKVSDVRKK